MGIPRLASYHLPGRESVAPGAAAWELDPGKSALLVHDMQRYFVGFFGEQSPLAQALIANIGRLTAAARTAGVPVFYTAQPGAQSRAKRGLLYDFWGPGIGAGLEQTGIVPELTPHATDTCIIKHRYSAFCGTPLREMLNAAGRTQLVVSGVYAHIGCLATTLDAFMADIRPFLVIDAVADFTLEDHLMAARYVSKRCGGVTDAAAVTAAFTPAAAQLRPGRAIPESLGSLKVALSSLLNLPCADIADDAYLPDLGLDSITVMEFAESWRELRISYVSLFENPTPRGWMDLVLHSQRVLQSA